MSRILALVLCLNLAVAQTPNPSIKEQVLMISAGAPVEVKLKDKRKLRGRIGAANDESFVVQHVSNGKMTDEKIPFAEVKSVKLKERGMSTAAKVAIGAAAGAGGVILAVWLIALSID